MRGFQGNHIEKMDVIFLFAHVNLDTMYVEGKMFNKTTKM